MISILSNQAIAGHILVDLLNHDPNSVPPWHQLVTFWSTWSIMNPSFVPPGSSWSHFGNIGFGFGKVRTEEEENVGSGLPGMARAGGSRFWPDWTEFVFFVENQQS
jgi:hypothetical protein